jgi:hypothetical protein
VGLRLVVDLRQDKAARPTGNVGDRPLFGPGAELLA